MNTEKTHKKLKLISKNILNFGKTCWNYSRNGLEFSWNKFLYKLNLDDSKLLWKRTFVKIISKEEGIERICKEDWKFSLSGFFDDDGKHGKQQGYDSFKEISFLVFVCGKASKKQPFSLTKENCGDSELWNLYFKRHD